MRCVIHVVLGLVLSALASLDVPVAAEQQVTGLRAVNREGQTFLTWKEDGESKGEWYRVYASRQAISTRNFDEAKLVAKIPEGSNRFGFLRNIDPKRSSRLCEILQEKRCDAIQIEDYEDGRKQLSDGTGLFVHTVKEDAQTFYAVTVERDGDETRTIRVGENSLAEPAHETTGVPGAILQRKLGDRHYLYAFFCDYETWNPDGVDDNWDGYAHVFQIRAPDPETSGSEEPYPISFRLHAYSAWQDWNIRYCFPKTHVDVRLLDYHLTWWYGFSDALPKKEDNSRIPPPDRIVNFTEQRVLQVARWLGSSPKNFPFRVDPSRISVMGGSMGGSGANFVGVRNGDVFAGSSASKGVTDWSLPPEDNTWANNVTAIFGPQDRNDLTNEGVPVYDLLDLPKWANTHRDRESAYLDTANGIIDLVIPFASVPDLWKGLEAGKHPYASGWDMVGHASRLGSGGPMDYKLLRIDEMTPAIANASCNTPLRSGFRIYSKYAAVTERTLSIQPGQLKDSEGVNVDGSFPPDLAGKTLVLAPSPLVTTTFTIAGNTATELTVCEGDLLEHLPPLTNWDRHVLGQQIKMDEGKEREPTDAELQAYAAEKKKRFLICDGEPRGTWNGHLAWSSSLQNFDPQATEDDIVDEPKRLAFCIRLQKNRLAGDCPEDTATADITPRRCQQFRPRPGEVVRWENWDCANSTEPKKIAEGIAAADDNGLVTIPQFVIGKTGWGNRLVLTPE